MEEIEGLKNLEGVVMRGCYAGYFDTTSKRAGAFGFLALAQQLSRIANALESILTLMQQREEREWRRRPK